MSRISLLVFLAFGTFHQLFGQSPAPNPSVEVTIRELADAFEEARIRADGAMAKVLVSPQAQVTSQDLSLIHI